MKLYKFLVIYHGNTFVDGDGMDFVTINEHALEDLCYEFEYCRKNAAYLATKVEDAKQKGVIGLDEVVE